MKNKSIFLIVFLAIGLSALHAQAATGLILPEGEAWITTKGNLSSGYIFQTDGTCLSINNYDGEKVGEWTVISNLNWKVNRNEIDIENPDNFSIRSYEFSLSGDTLTLSLWGSPEIYTRTSGIRPTTPRYQ